MVGASVGWDEDSSDGEIDPGELDIEVEEGIGVVSWEVITVFAPASGCNVEPLTAGSSLPAALSIATVGVVETISGSLGGRCSTSVDALGGELLEADSE